jgi:Putative Actinobacterial Holin-X, holin superfamily III
MHTPAAETEQAGVGAAAKQVAEHASTLAKLELELAGLELKQKAGALGSGVGLGVGAAVVTFYAAALAIVLDTWLALLIVALGLLAVAGVLGLLARSLVKRATPPLPELAIREAKLTSEALKSNGHH